MIPSPINRTAGRPASPVYGRAAPMAPNPYATQVGQPTAVPQQPQQNPGYGQMPPRQAYKPPPPNPYGQMPPRQAYKPPPNPYERLPMPQPGAPQPNPMAKFNQQGRPMASRANLLPNQMNTWQQRFNGAQGGRATGQPAAMSRMRQVYGGGGAPAQAMPNPATAQPGQSARGLMALPYGGGG